MKYIIEEHKTIYNILKKQKENYNYMELFNLIKKSNIRYDSQVTHKKTLEYYIVNEASEMLLIKLKSDGLLNSIHGSVYCANILEDKNIERLQIIAKHNIGNISNNAYISKIFSNDPILQQKILYLFENKTLSPVNLEFSENNAYLSHYYSPLDSLKKLQILEKCGFEFKPQDFFHLSSYISDAECNAIINYFKNKVDLNKSFSLIMKNNIEGDCNIKLNIMSHYILKNIKHPFFKALHKHNYKPFFSSDIHKQNLENFKNLDSFITDNPETIFNKKEKVTSLSIALSQRNNEYISTSRCMYLYEVLRRTNMENLYNIESFIELCQSDYFALQEILNPFSLKYSLFSMLNYDEEIKSKKFILNIIKQCFYQQKELFHDYKFLTDHINLIRKNEFLQDFYFYNESEIFTTPIFAKMIIYCDSREPLKINEILKYNLKFSLKDHLVFLFNASNQDFSHYQEPVKSKNELLDSITQSIFTNFQSSSQNYFQQFIDFQLNTGPEKWENPEDVSRISYLSSQFKKIESVNEIKNVRRL